MTVLGFTMTFHSPFRVGAEYARDGVHAALDPQDVLPADHLKGMMRAAAEQLCGDRHPAVAEVFGTPRRPSPWSWSAAVPSADPVITQRHRVTISHQTHTALKDHLVLGDQAWMPAARFEVTRYGPPGDFTEDDHVLLLRCAAAGIHSIGAWRRRGLGWVGTTPDDGPVTAGDVTRLLALKGQRQ